MGTEQPVTPARSAVSERTVGGTELVALAEGAIVVCYASLAVSDAIGDRLARTLDGEEKARAEAFLSRSAGNRFAVARGTVRAVLARHLNVVPTAVRFTYGPNGKPEVSGPEEAPPLSFNVSHSEDELALAVAMRGPLGIDIELLRPMPDAEDLAAKILSAKELAAFLDLPLVQRAYAFLVAWVRKEACLKAVGAGLSLPATAFEIMATPGSTGDIPVAGFGSDDMDWHLHDLDPGEGYVGAVVAPGSARRIAAFDITWRDGGELSLEPRVGP